MLSSRKPVGSIVLVVLLVCSVVQGYVIKIDFHQGKPETFDIPHANLTADELLRDPRSVVFSRDSSIDKRQNCLDSNTVTTYNYELIGDGDPHQNYKIVQMDDTLMSCPGTITSGHSSTTSWSFQVGLNPGYKQTDFASLGFSVTETETKSVENTFNCPGSDGTEICAFHYTAVTALSVTFYKHELSCGITTTTSLGPGTVWLPNSNGIGSTVSRGTNFGARNIIQCRGQAEREIDFNCGPKGGPEWFNTNEYGPWSDAYMAALDPPDCAVPIEALKFKS